MRLLALAALWAVVSLLVNGIELARAQANPAKFPVPEHVVKWDDKLKVQKIMDIMNAEITKNGTQPVDEQCDSLFGKAYISSWANAKKEICKPGGGSTYTCHEHPGTNRGPNIGSLVRCPGQHYRGKGFMGHGRGVGDLACVCGVSLREHGGRGHWCQAIRRVRRPILAGGASMTGNASMDHQTVA